MTSRVAPKAMISLRDKFKLSPIEKHIEYSKFWTSFPSKQYKNDSLINLFFTHFWYFLQQLKY